MENSPEKNKPNEAAIEKNLNELDYPSNEDIYNNGDKLENINPDNINTEKTITKKGNAWQENAFDVGKEDKMGGDLDVPGSELDDQQEKIGSEDEENNYYSEGDN